MNASSATSSSAGCRLCDMGLMAFGPDACTTQRRSTMSPLSFLIRPPVALGTISIAQHFGITQFWL
jgi:hypothetical protein